MSHGTLWRSLYCYEQLTNSVFLSFNGTECMFLKENRLLYIQTHVTQRKFSLKLMMAVNHWFLLPNSCHSTLSGFIDKQKWISVCQCQTVLSPSTAIDKAIKRPHFLLFPLFTVANVNNLWPNLFSYNPNQTIKNSTESSPFDGWLNPLTPSPS